MAEADHMSPRSRVLHELTSVGSRAARAGIKPLTDAVGTAAGLGVRLEQRAIDRVLEDHGIERLLVSPRLQELAEQVLRSEGAKQLLDTLIDSGLVDRLLERLLASDALWRLVDEIACSPTVAAAISRQGFGFADQVGDQVRVRSRRADAWIEGAARRLTDRRRPRLTGQTDVST